MDNEQYQSKFFLTGFLLASAILIYVTMIFVMIFLASLINSVLISFIVVIAVGIFNFYALYKFERETKFSKLAWYYVLVITSLGLLTSAIGYLSILGILIANLYFGSGLAIIISIILGYIVLMEVFSLLALFAVSFELREVHYRKFPTVYVLTVVTLLVVAYVFKDYTYSSGLTTSLTIGSSLIASYYVLDGIRKGPIKMDVESLEERYRFVIAALIHIALSPVHLPLSIKSSIQERNIKQN